MHCYAHRLNLVLVDCCKSVNEAVDFFAFLEKLYVFISSAVPHKIWLEAQKEMYKDEPPRQLQRLSDTRWACRVTAIQSNRSRSPTPTARRVSFQDMPQVFDSTDKQSGRKVVGLRLVTDLERLPMSVLQIVITCLFVVEDRDRILEVTPLSLLSSDHNLRSMVNSNSGRMMNRVQINIV